MLAESGPTTFKLIKSLVPKEDLATIQYDDLVKVVQNHSEPKPSVIVERYKFNSRVQGDGESIASYVAALRHLTKYCDYGTKTC